MVFIIRLCTSVSPFCSQAFHCDDVTLCLALRTQFSSVFNMIIYFPQKIIILMHCTKCDCKRFHLYEDGNDRSKSHEAAALLRRAASILTQNFSENQGSSSQNVRNNNIGNTGCIKKKLNKFEIALNVAKRLKV